ncbi:hypothetical protein CHS0354_036881 [Potamilus streckersoni]|uniref:rhomboid protease n=1 Tax=Potamilus streckersoni TaxID=2493646 RepID=A0AAE0T2M6_9BIVA|nr:hypothetical protein CHS0354_036881 [Potamilus streckersoni]
MALAYGLLCARKILTPRSLSLSAFLSRKGSYGQTMLCHCMGKKVQYFELPRCGTFQAQLRHFYRSARQHIRGNKNVQQYSEFNSLFPHVQFTCLVCGLSFVGAMIWNYENIARHHKRIIERGGMLEFPGIKKHTPPRNFGLLSQLINWYTSLPAGRKLIFHIIGVNCGIFLLWKFAPWQVMMRYFQCAPTKAHSVTSMVFSTFSHVGSFHLAANMYVLWSFSKPIQMFLSKEEFFAFFLSAGTVSSLVSCMYKVRRGLLIPSLGASGAMYAVLAATCYMMPDSRVTLAVVGEIFDFSFSSKSAMYALLAVETAGVLCGWKFFDHAAHLGGLLFGLWYMRYGQNWIWNKRQHVMKIWHDIRQASKRN